MTTWDYGIYVTLNNLWGYSFLKGTVGIISFVLMSLNGIIGIFTLYYVFKKYKKTGNIGDFIFFLAGIFLFTGVIATVIRDISSSLNLFGIRDIMLILSIICIAAAAVCSNVFSIRYTYPEKVKIFTILFVIPIAILNISVLSWAIINDVASTRAVLVQDPYIHFMLTFEYPLIIQLIIYITAIPSAIFPPAVFFYFARKIQEENKPQSSLSVWFGISLLCIGFGYIFEFFIFIPLLILPLLTRGLYLSFIIIMYIIFSFPDWFKRRINWPD
ncbi:MAG: hypothetical protein ACFFDN_50275 [Candidatus Hodarchaeota archaeon]